MPVMPWLLLLALLSVTAPTNGLLRVPLKQGAQVCGHAHPLANTAPVMLPGGGAVEVGCWRSAGPHSYRVWRRDVHGRRLLGVAANAETLAFDRRLPNGSIALRGETGGGTFEDRFVLVIDARPNADLLMREVARQRVFAPRYIADPPRYEWTRNLGNLHAVFWYDVLTDAQRPLWQQPCVVLEGFGCRTLVAASNADATQPTPTRLALLYGVPLSTEGRLLEVRALPQGTLLFSATLLDTGRATWQTPDLLAVANARYDLDAGAFTGFLVRFGPDVTVLPEATPAPG